MNRVFCGLFGLVLAHAAVAADSAAAPDASRLEQALVVAPIKTMKPLWEFGVGVAALRYPDYRGSDQSSSLWLPVPFGVYRGKWLRADRDGARAVLFDSTRVEVDVSVSGSPPTRSKDNLARSGMPDLKAAFEIGPNVNVTLMQPADGSYKLDFRMPVRAGFTVERSPRSIGYVVSPVMNLDLRRVGGGWDVGLLTGPLFGDARYHNRIYGVDAAFATPQRPAYRAGGGYSGWQSLASLSRRFDTVWVGAFVRHDSLRGAAFADSPLVRRDSALTWGVALSWVLGASTELVEVAE
jgi:MipA family protein